MASHLHFRSIYSHPINRWITSFFVCFIVVKSDRNFNVIFLFVIFFCNIKCRTVVWNINEKNALERLAKSWTELTGTYVVYFCAWWRDQMETFSALLAICAGNSPVTGEFPAQRPVTRSSDVFFDLHINKLLSKQWWGWWLRRHRAHYDVTVMGRGITHFSRKGNQWNKNITLSMKSSISAFGGRYIKPTMLLSFNGNWHFLISIKPIPDAHWIYCSACLSANILHNTRQFSNHNLLHALCMFNILCPSDAYMRQGTGSVLEHGFI